jgi:hypothetical protein
MLREAGVSTSEESGVEDAKATTSADANSRKHITTAAAITTTGRNEVHGDTVASLKRLLQNNGVTTEGSGGVDAGDIATTSTGTSRDEVHGDTVASLKRLLKNSGVTTEGSDGADANAAAVQSSKKNDGDVEKQNDDNSNRQEGNDTITDLKRLIRDAEEENKRRDLLIANQKKEMEDMKARLEQARGL